MWSRTNPPGHQAGTFSPAANHGRPQAQLIGTLHSAPTATRDQNENSHKMITQWNGVFVETHGRAGTSSPTWYPLTHAVHRLQQPPAAMSKATRRLKQAFEAAVTNKCKLLFTARKQRPFPRASNLSHLNGHIGSIEQLFLRFVAQKPQSIQENSLGPRLLTESIIHVHSLHLHGDKPTCDWTACAPTSKPFHEIVSWFEHYKSARLSWFTLQKKKKIDKTDTNLRQMLLRQNILYVCIYIHLHWI